MKSSATPNASRSLRLQRGQNIVEFAFVLVSLAVIALVLINVSGASNSDIVARVNCTLQGRQWADISTTSGSIPSPIYGCLKASIADASFYSTSYLGSRSNYLPGHIFDTRTHKRIG